MRTATSFALCALLSASCSSYKMRGAYVADEFAPSDGAPGRIEGQAFVRTAGGEVKFAAGLPIYLLKATPYSQEWFLAVGSAGAECRDLDARMWSHVLRTTGDGAGEFVFENVPPGPYFLWSDITWLYATGSWITPEKVTGARAAAQIRLGPGESKRVVATSPPPPVQ